MKQKLYFCHTLESPAGDILVHQNTRVTEAIISMLESYGVDNFEAFDCNNRKVQFMAIPVPVRG